MSTVCEPPVCRWIALAAPHPAEVILPFILAHGSFLTCLSVVGRVGCRGGCEINFLLFWKSRLALEAQVP